ncbi:MAG: putative dual-specificity RNA methyltransferase RlmN [bacterium]|nr:putative dual-specificity RNA methyltransferase RlmN [bacterium]
MERSLYDYSSPELAALIAAVGEPSFRLQQVQSWLFKQRESDPAKMTNLPVALRAALAAAVVPTMLEAEAILESADGSRKVVWRLRDGARIETVWMPTESRLTLCLSSQVGCALGCTFCATGTMGLVRQLTPGEYLEQVLLLDRRFERRPDNLVLMGMGEPLHNRPHLDHLLHALGDLAGYGFSLTRVTLSTAGLMDELLEFHHDFPQVNLAISLVSPFDETRSVLMPINRKYPVARIAQTIRQIDPKWGGRVTLEYPLMAEINDRPEDVRELVRVFGGCRVKVNLIPYNTTAHATYSRPEREVIALFQDALQRAHIPAFVRWSRGQDVGAACGQLVTA